MPKCLLLSTCQTWGNFSVIHKQPQATNSVLLRYADCLNLKVVFFKTTNLVFIHTHMHTHACTCVCI